jgi:predicted P-loop ATPase
MTTIAEAARAYHERGWKPVPISRKTKRPINKEWQKRPYDPAQFNGSAQNVGIQLGAVSGGLVDVDLDCMDAIGFAPEFLPATNAIFGRRSKPCSHQLYVSDLYKTEKHAVIQYRQYRNGQAGAMIVELRIGGSGKGAATVVPPSLHASGEPVAWERNGEPARIGGEELKRAVTELAVASLLKPHYPDFNSRHEGALVIGGVLARADWRADDIAHVVEEVARAVGDNEVADRVTAAVGAVNVKANGGSVAGLERLREVWGEDVADTFKHWFKMRTPRLDIKASPEVYMARGTPLASNVANALIALEREPELVTAFAFDEMLRVEVLMRPLFKDDPHFKPRPVTDGDVTAVQKWLQAFGFRQLGKDTTHDAINKHARDHAFHPVRDYLNGLKWDGKGRLGTWLSTYLGAEQNDYTEQVGTMFLIGMVARIFEPGCKFDYMMILEGGQALLKSTACSILAGPQYFSDQLPDITSKEASQHLRGKWLIEVAELNAYSRAAIDHFKAFLVRQVERYRPPWGRKEVHELRQCAFIGTTNKSRYLRDETGNRRFWPVTIGEINLDALRRDRDQLLAEAVTLYRAGVHWWPDRDVEQQTIAPEQETRFEVDAWEPLIRDFLEEVNRTTMLIIAVGALGYELKTPPQSSPGEPPIPRGTPINRFGPKEQQRVSAILTHLGWEPKRNKRERWWVREKQEETEW